MLLDLILPFLFTSQPTTAILDSVTACKGTRITVASEVSWKQHEPVTGTRTLVIDGQVIEDGLVSDHAPYTLSFGSMHAMKQERQERPYYSESSYQAELTVSMPGQEPVSDWVKCTETMRER